MRILVVEDELNMAEALCEILDRNGYNTECVHDGKAGLHMAMSGVFDLILLDVMLPKINGFEILKKLRKSDRETPVIMLTAMNGINDKVTGLDYGADDYLSKPFNTDELLARIRSALRRNAPEDLSEQITLGNTTLYPKRLKIVANTREVILTERENNLAVYFFRNETVVLPYSSILTQVWEGAPADDDTLIRYVGFLNRKLTYIEAQVTIIEIRGVGFKLLQVG